ncbi:MAG: branched-chain amino acid aminotransferase [Spirochaetes bacterium]|nr:branched-chain amino acid aminotransferase [Spirochaetota bacterium]
MRQTADLDWSNLPFSYVKTDFNIRYFYRDGKWSQGELFSDDNVSLSIAAPSLHYGQQAFEGLKVFETVDKKIVCFRPGENSSRMNHTNSRILMPQIPEKMFLEAIDKVVKANLKFVPPYGTGASLYIRPLIIGAGPKVGLGPAEEYIFIVFVTPVGPYYKGGFKPVDALVLESYDRAAPQGVGDCKVGGNYAAGLPGSNFGKEKGFPVVLYLDPREKKYIDEFATSNFIAIKDNTYITPVSESILPSITNKTLAEIAADSGMKVEKRPVEISEIKNFQEIGAVGTAAVLTPVRNIVYRDQEYNFAPDGKPGPVLTSLYEKYTGIQLGNIEDKFGWLHEIK